MIHPYIYIGLDIDKVRNLSVLLDHVSNKLGISIEDIRSVKRQHDIVNARLIFSNLAINLGFTCVKVAKFINRDHATVVHYKAEFDKINYNPKLKEAFLKVSNNIPKDLLGEMEIEEQYELVQKGMERFKNLVNLSRTTSIHIAELRKILFKLPTRHNQYNKLVKLRERLNNPNE